MMTLYVKTGCPFCKKVRDCVAEMGIQDMIEEKNVADDGVVDELIEKGGKKQVPYLIDAEKGVEMYESDDICNYLKENYGN
ncbi:MAG: glutathione S-transferase N-terminal domain-containing protein [Patescibacteria group bacterium UBA2103]